ncbi:Alanyl-tRNA synthetase [Hyphodiscus hymeniophilus]|uniref:Alanyl-tRNA synthetase n=1 Tax=Hyphodiscus hymeniophilus TaxID=353542 RepID=A0A9P7AVV1_9HELO|nr:Alanyl-tRNA synthetase [Hyphodiscus hymeniophilus]
MAARTKLVYQQHGELRKYLSKVLSISPVSTLPEADQSLLKNPSEEDYALITDETIFYVQGGGQPSDIGTIEPASSETESAPVFEVSSVRHPATGGAILHFGRFKPNAGAGSSVFQVGNEVQQTIDAEKRDLFSRLHTAGHILGLAINALSREGVLPALIESKASHYPDSAAVEFGGVIEGKHKDAIQAKTDEFVKRASKVLIHWWPMERLLKDCTGVTEGFEIPDGEELGRVVEMEGLGAYPCGGTHVEHCGLVGKIEVRKIARSKGVSRVSYKVS